MDPNAAIFELTTKLTWLTTRSRLREVLGLLARQNMFVGEQGAQAGGFIDQALTRVPGEREALKHWFETNEWVATDLDSAMAQQALNLFEWLDRGGFRPDAEYVESFQAAFRRTTAFVATPVLLNLHRKLN
jgi:hypothetical protein